MPDCGIANCVTSPRLMSDCGCDICVTSVDPEVAAAAAGTLIHRVASWLRRLCESSNAFLTQAATAFADPDIGLLRNLLLYDHRCEWSHSRIIPLSWRLTGRTARIIPQVSI
jgi:hypothetical protein